MPTPLGSFEGARNAVITRIIAELPDEIDQIAAIQAIDERLRRAKTPVDVPRVVKKGWLRTEDITDVIDAIETNITYVAVLADLLRAAGKLSQLLIETRAKAAAEASRAADNYISDLLVYLNARKGGGDAIIISPDDVTGNFSTIGRAFMPKVASASTSVISIKSVDTNGMRGNLLELDPSTEVNKPLDTIKFVNPVEDNINVVSLNDGDFDTFLEVEAIKVIDTGWIEFGITRSVNGKLDPLNWNAIPAGGKLVAELVGKVPSGKLSTVAIVPDLSNTEKITIESVEYSKQDGKKWYMAIGPHYVSRGTGAYETGGSTGEAIWVIPGGRANNIRIRVAQDTPYRTKVATVDYVLSGTTGPLVHGPDLVNTTNKLQYFTPSKNVVHGADQLERTVIARLADRWRIAIKELEARANEYERSTVFQTKTYELPAPCDRLGITADEVIPNGCSITYEVSHDGVTWTKFVPMERTSGKEIVVFSAGGEANPLTDPGAVFVQTNSPVTQITLRISMTSKGTDAPAISNLAIHPVLKR